MTRVVHCKKEAYDVYIGRPSKWGNPVPIGLGTHEEAVTAYREWIVKQPHLMAALHELKGKVLGCWCHPKPCHGDVLAEMAEKVMEGGVTKGCLDTTPVVGPGNPSNGSDPLRQL